jgi:hypothetical protein
VTRLAPLRGGQLDDKRALIVLSVVGGLHGLLALVLKVYFYS